MESTQSVARGLTLILNDLNSRQVISQRRHVQKVMKNRDFIREFKRLKEEVVRYETFLKTVAGERGSKSFP